MKYLKLIEIKQKLTNKFYPLVIIKNTHAYETVFFCYTLSFLGGFLDAHTYLVRDGVFVSTQSVNFVMFAINISEANYFKALHKFIPICAFLVGTIWAKWIQKKNNHKMSHSIAMELLIYKLIIFTFIGIFDNGRYTSLSNIILSFITAVQFVTFNKIAHFQYASTVIMGNLKSFSEAIYLDLSSKKSTQRKFHRQKVKIFGMLLASFAFGAILGGIMTKAWSTKAILFCEILVFINIVIIKVDQKHHEYLNKC